MKNLIFALCVVVMFSTSANAIQVYVAGTKLVDMWRECKKCDEGKKCDLQEAAFYQGYILGIVDHHKVINGYAFKLPSNALAGQLYEVVGKWLDNHPEKWNEGAIDLVFEALQAAFPLKKK